ncbi:hypothetical protein EYB25_002226 [Talaromyces marneffei]|nr:hypothetical protein EYB25_002226 [Talaromyces marneffei]
MSEATQSSSYIPPVFRVDTAVPDRLVSLIPDELAEKVPEHPLFAYPKTTRPQDGFVEVTAKCFANAINRTSWYLESTLGKATPGAFPSVGYMGSSMVNPSFKTPHDCKGSLPDTGDLRYFLFLFGAIKAGYKMLYLSPRNNVAGHLNVLEKSDCNIFLSAKETRVEHILSQRKMQTAIVPELEELLDETSAPTYPYTKTFEEARKDPCLILHTTGSTGLPKPITWKLEILSTYEAWRTIPSMGEYVSMTEIYQEAHRAYNAMPLFHTSGLNTGITLSLLLGVTTVFGAANVVPNAAYADEMHKYAGVDASIGPPSLYEDLSHETDTLDRIDTLRYVLVCGAPLSQVAGDVVSKRTRLISNFGATETACLPRLAPGREDWSYYYWHPSHSGIELREYMDDLYELFIVRKPELELYQGIFSTFPDLQEYSMNDIYSKHPDPTKGFLYKWRGRADDVIVLSNGEKLAPALMEAGLMSSPLVKGAMVVGRGKFQPAALLDLGDERPDTASGRFDILKDLLPAIAEANKHAPAHGKLDQNHVLLVDPARPIYYLGQGKIQRHQTYKAYEEDIENLYLAADNLDDQMDLDQSLSGDLSKVDFSDLDSIKQWLKDLILLLTEMEDLQPADSFFQSGVDSLHVLRIIREIKIQVKLYGGRLLPEMLTSGVVYSHPSLDELCEFLFKKANLTLRGLDSGYQSVDSDDEDVRPKSKDMESVLNEYVESLPRIDNRVAPVSVSQGMTVLLTGSTGSLGSYLLNSLNNDPNVEHIICLDRTSAAEKHKELGPRRGLAPLDSDRVEFIKADLSQDHLGVEEELYNRLVGTVTHIIHCQWPVNFNWTLNSFKPYISGVRNLASLAASSSHNAFLLFVSSVAAVGGWKGPGDVPEVPIHDLGMAANTGYGQSKLIAECLLDKAAELSGVRSACCRVGIVAGPVEQPLGMWNKHEYIPSIIISSVHLGAFPKTFPSRDEIDWLPVDKLSKILLEILASASQSGVNEEIIVDTKENNPRTKIYHVVNPYRTSWHGDFATHLRVSYPSDTPLQGVTFEEWVGKLNLSAEEAEKADNVDIERNPAIRLLQFYANAATSKEKGRRLWPIAAVQASETLRALGPLGSTWLENWMVQWGIKSN